MHENLIELGYSEKKGMIEVTLPSGFTSQKFGRISDRLIADLINRLPRGCQACLSGESLIIRERLENVLRVDLDSMEIVEKG
ncbi:MAG TPA: hypothetical protein VEV43_08965 [Actinomycetota bacterium]|nr:hypothetical protein [Actinomycetota bacterium]